MKLYQQLGPFKSVLLGRKFEFELLCIFACGKFVKRKKKHENHEKRKCNRKFSLLSLDKKIIF